MKKNLLVSLKPLQNLLNLDNIGNKINQKNFLPNRFGRVLTQSHCMFRLFVALTLITCVCFGQDYVTVPTSYGSVKGVSLETTNEFLGIPFAQPPVGTLRFAPPLPFVPPSDPNYIQDATKYKSACIQAMNSLYTFPGPPSEDCLYLNIYAPKSETPKPVMVWIHGGAYIGGSATQDNYNASIIAQKGDVIVVTINYRLGVLGYTAISEFCSQNPHCGFYGILDQQLALQWVQQNINAFGGNPNNVTIFGYCQFHFLKHTTIVINITGNRQEQ